MATTNTTTTFQYVDYLWDDAHATSLGDDQVALFLYRSNILGADLRITNYGGGNTSCKTMEKDPLTGKEVEVVISEPSSVQGLPAFTQNVCVT